MKSFEAERQNKLNEYDAMVKESIEDQEARLAKVKLKIDNGAEVSENDWADLLKGMSKTARLNREMAKYSFREKLEEEKAIEKLEKYENL